VPVPGLEPGTIHLAGGCSIPLRYTGNPDFYRHDPHGLLITGMIQTMGVFLLRPSLTAIFLVSKGYGVLTFHNLLVFFPFNSFFFI
jgi:hypothetical protein